MWRLSDQLQSVSHNCAGSVDAFLVAEFTSSFGKRIMCLDASFENEVFVSFILLNRKLFNFIVIYWQETIIRISTQVFQNTKRK